MVIKLTEKESLKVLDEIITTLKLAGYDPYIQLEGYIETGSDVYITRSNNAREKSSFLNWILLARNFAGIEMNIDYQYCTQVLTCIL